MSDFLVLVAGTNEPSNSHALARAFSEGIEQMAGTSVHTYRLKDLQIEHFTIDVYQTHCQQEEDFCMLQALMEKSAGVVIATPIWNFGVPAHLKNFIDRMGSFALDETRTKGVLGGLPFYLIYTGGAPLGAWAVMKRTTSFVTTALRYFGASVVGTHYEPGCTRGKGQFGLVTDKRPESLNAMRTAGLAFARLCDTHQHTGALPLRHRTLQAVYTWGQRILKNIR